MLVRVVVHVDCPSRQTHGQDAEFRRTLLSDDTAEEITPLAQKILATKLWNEGQKASHIAVPSQYALEGASAAKEQRSSDPISASEARQEGTNNAAAATTRSEQVWGGKPWKTNVMEFEGEVLCSAYERAYSQCRAKDPDGQWPRHVYAQYRNSHCMPA